MPKEEKIEVTGKVLQELGNARFRVELENGTLIIAHVSGKMRKNKIRISVGDNVDVKLSPYDLDKGIITYRNKQ